MSAQVGKNELIARGQGLGGGQPEFMMSRKRMEQNQRRSRPLDMVCNLGVATGDVNHSGLCGSDAPYPNYETTAWCPAGASARSGSSGITTQAMGYESNPMPVITAVINHTSRTRVTSRSKYSAKPAQTPAILRSPRGRTRRRRETALPIRLPQ